MKPAFAVLAFLTVVTGAAAQTSAPRRDGRVMFVPLATSTQYAPHAVIRAVDPATGSMTTIAPGKNIDTENPTPSPNGRRLAFTRGQLEGTARRGLFVADANGRHARRISKLAGFSPTWSPDGSRLAYVWNDVVILRADGSDVHHLQIPGATQVAWSSRNQLLITHGLNAPLLELVRPDGSGLRTLRRGQPDDAFVNPKWSPDGRRIIYQHWTGCDGSFCSTGPGMEIADLRGNVVRSLGDGEFPTWSPSGTRIAYATVDGVFIRSLGDGSTRQIFKGSLETAGIGWQALELGADPPVPTPRISSTKSERLEALKEPPNRRPGW